MRTTALSLALLAAPALAGPPVPIPVPAAPSGRPAPTPTAASWRPVRLSGGRAEDLQERIDRGFELLFGEVLQGIRARAPGAYLETDGARFQVVVPQLSVHFGGLDGWEGELHGHFRAEDLRLDYAPLGVGEVRFGGVPVLDGALTSRSEALVEHLLRDSFQEATLRFPQGPGRLVLEGQLEIKIFIFAIRPELRLEGFFARRGQRFVFHPTQTYVSNVPGFIRARLRDRLERRAEVGFGLDQAMARLRRKGVRFGEIRLTHTQGGEPVRSSVLPQLAPGYDDLPSE